VDSVRQWQKLLPCLTEAMLSGFMVDPLLAKAEAISDGANTSGVTGLRRGTKHCAMAIAAGEKGVRICEKPPC